MSDQKPTKEKDVKKWNIEWNFNYSGAADGIEAEDADEAKEKAYEYAKLDFEDCVECFAVEADEDS